MLLLSSTRKLLKRQTVLELRIHSKHLSVMVNKQDFATKFVHAFVLCDKPLAKLNHPAIQKLFRDFGQSVPSDTRYHLKVKECETNDWKLAKDLSEKPLFLL